MDQRLPSWAGNCRRKRVRRDRHAPGNHPARTGYAVCCSTMSVATHEDQTMRDLRRKAASRTAESVPAPSGTDSLAIPATCDP